MNEWKEFTREEVEGFVKVYGLNPDDFYFYEDDEEAFERVYYTDTLCIGLVRSKYFGDDIYDCYYMDIVRFGMEWCRDGWVGPVKYIRAVMPIKLLTKGK